jgi:hypothetical protein
MRYFLILGTVITICGCTTTKPLPPPPSVSTAQVIDSLNNTKEALAEAGEQNTLVALKIERALTLAERLDALLEQIEKDAAIQANKNIIKPL